MAQRKPENPGGRPSKFDRDTAMVLIVMLERRKSIRDAAKSTGIGVSTLQRWLKLGREGDPRFDLLATAADASIAHRFKFNSIRKIKRYDQRQLEFPSNDN